MSRDEEARLLLLTMSLEEILASAPCRPLCSLWDAMLVSGIVPDLELQRRLPALLAAPVVSRQDIACAIADFVAANHIALTGEHVSSLARWETYLANSTQLTLQPFEDIAEAAAPVVGKPVPEILLEFFDALCSNRAIYPSSDR
jgi:hypothetical protein